jgi:hypothetical protein
MHRSRSCRPKTPTELLLFRVCVRVCVCMLACIRASVHACVYACFVLHKTQNPLQIQRTHLFNFHNFVVEAFCHQYIDVWLKRMS